MIRPCPLCRQPLRPARNEYGDTVLRRGFVVSCCKNGHHVTAIPRPDKALRIARVAA